MSTGVELATAWVQLVPTMKGVNGEVAKALAPVEGEADAAGKKAGGRFTTGFKAGMTLLAGAVVGVVGKALLSAVNAASDLNEAGTAVGAIFGDSFGTIDKWASKANTTLGQSHLEALNAAKSFGVYGQAAGLTTEENAKFSTSLAGLATDFASFHNVPVADAIEAIGSGLRGEAEPLRKFGVLLDDASLRAQAMKMGIYDGNGTLTAQQKILAANALIFAQSGAAQGDFQRTSEGMANQQRILTASFENLSATLGVALMPAMQGLLSVAQPITTWLTENPALVQILAVTLAILAVAILAVVAGMWLMALNPVGITIGVIAIAVGILIAAIVALAMNWDNVVSWISSVWSGFVNWITAVFSGFISWITGIVNGFFGWWNGIWSSVGNAIATVFRIMGAIVQVLFGDQIAWLIGKVNAFFGWWNGIWAIVSAAYAAAWRQMTSIVTSIWSGFSGWIMGAVNGFFGWWNGIWSSVGNVIHTVFSNVASFIAGIWDGIVSKIRGAVNGIIGSINGLIGGLNGFLGAVGKIAGVNLKVGTIPKLANGGTITGAGTVLVGERGPELLNLPAGASVDPNIAHAGMRGGVVFQNFAPLGRTPAQALSEFANRAGGLL